MTKPSRWDSIEWKLPALIGGLLLVVAFALGFIAYTSLERTLLSAAEDRLGAATDLLVQAIEPGFTRRAALIDQLAAKPEVRALLSDPSADPAAAQAALKGMVATGAALELRAADGSCLTGFSRTGEPTAGAACAAWKPAAVARTTTLPLEIVQDSARLGMAAPVWATAADSTMAPSGYLLETRALSPAAGIQLIEGLIGSSAQLYLANADGSLWTDLSTVVPAPHSMPLSDTGLRQYEREGEGRLAVTRPLKDTPLVVAIEFPRAAVMAPTAAFLRRSMLAALLTILVGLLGAWVVGHRIARPLRDASEAAEAVALGGKMGHIQVPGSGRDEVGRFALAFNVMAEEVERHRGELESRVERRTQLLKDTIRQLRDTQDELVKKEKMATLGQLASSVGHELRNPLGVMSNAVYFLKMVLKDPGTTVTEYLGIMKHQITLSEKIISDLLDFSRVKAPQTETVAVQDLVAAQLDRVGSPAGIEIVTSLPPDLPPVRVDKVQVGQVLFNLLTNAVQAMEAGGTLEVTAASANGDGVRLAVTDTGTGIAPDKVETIFDPLFTTKARGIGLGLSVARSLARANHGEIEVVSEVGRGSTFTITMPSVAPSAHA